MENSITVGEELRKYFYESGLNFLSSVPQRRIQEMILAMAQKGHSGKMTDCGELGMGHRTTYGHFLSKGKWDHEKVEAVQRQKSFQTILSVAEKANQTVFLSIDDTVVPKKKPSRRAARPMEGTGWHYSHLEGKKVYGYQIHAAIASTGSSTLCYSLRRCCPEHGTKVDMTVEVIDSIQESEIPIYVLMDSWYTNADVWNKCKEKKCHLIGAMKTNRILYPNGVRTSASDYASILTQDQFHLVTVKGREYYVHRYQGHLNKIDQAIVLLTYPKEAFGVCTALKVFLCSDLSLSDEEVLEHYSHRWKIEVMFKQQKQYLGLKSFMIRSAKAVDRFLIILPLAWFWFTRETELLLPFSVGIRRYRGILSIF